METKRSEIVRATDTTVAVPDVKGLMELAKNLLDSGLFPGVRNVQGAFTVIQAGLEVGIPPVAALNTMAVINGKLTMEAKAYLALASARANVTWTVTKETPEECEVTFHRKGFQDVVGSYTRAEAERAKLLGKANWLMYPKDMLFARAAGRGVRRIAPDAVLGIYIKEEIQDTEPLEVLKPELDTKIAAILAKPVGDIKDEFTDPPAQGEAQPPTTDGPKGEDVDIVAEAEAVDEPQDLKLLETYAKRKAALAQLGINEDKLWVGIQRCAEKTWGHEIGGLDELDNAQLGVIVDYLTKWEKAKQDDLKKKTAEATK